MKKIAFIAMLLVATTSCTSLFNNNLFGTNENRHSNDPYSHVTQQAGMVNKPGQHVTQTNNKPGYNNGYYGNNYNTQQVRVGTIVNSLPSKNVKTATVNGQTLYLYQGVYYQRVRVNNGTAFKVVGYQN